MTGPARLAADRGNRLELALQSLGIAPLLGAGLAIILTVVFGELPGEGKYSAVLQDGCHAPAFGALGLITLTLLARRGTRPGASPARTALRQAILLIPAMLALGAATEVLQGLLGRDAELEDVASDVIGAGGIASLWVYAALYRDPRPGARVGRLVALLVCVTLAALWAAPLIRCGLAYWSRGARFPVLAQFESPLDLYFITVDPPPPRLVTTQHAHPPATALRVALDGNRWPGMTLTEPMANWIGYRELALDLANPERNALTLRLRINDRAHRGAFDDRFNSELRLAPLARETFHIPLEQIARGPRTRRMDMGRIAQLTLFRDGSAPGEAVLVYRIWLQ